MTTLQLHPLHIVMRDHSAIVDWSFGKPDARSRAAIGALSELIVSTHLGIRVVSHLTYEHDLSDGSCLVEVKTHGPGSKLSGKVCNMVARVKLRKRPGGGIQVDEISTRPHPDPADGRSHWTRAAGFTPFRIL